MKTIPLLRTRNKIRNLGIGMGMEGVVQCMVVDSKTKKVVKSYPPQKNLILNQGMDNFATSNICDQFLAGAAGTGTTPTQDSSGVTTAARAGTTVTLVGGSFVFTNTATDAGKMIKWLTNEEARIVTVTDTTHCEVATSGTIAAATFTVFRTNQTGLATETKRSNTYLTGAGNTETTINSGAGSISHKRTYDFSAEVGSVTYTEIGLSSTTGAGANLFSRILLASSVALVASQQLRLIYTLTITFSPVTDTTVGASPITGAAGATGHQQIQYPNMTAIRTTSGATDLKPPDGVSGVNDASAGFEPSRVGADCLCWLSTSSTTFNAFGSQGPSRNGAAPSSGNSTGSGYSTLSFTRTKTFVFSTSQGNGTTWRSMVIGGQPTAPAGSNQAFVYIFDSNFTKDNTHTLTINLVLTWGRTLA